jgi:hypothetical protein
MSRLESLSHCAAPEHQPTFPRHTQAHPRPTGPPQHIQETRQVTQTTLPPDQASLHSHQSHYPPTGLHLYPLQTLCQQVCRHLCSRNIIHRNLANFNSIPEPVCCLQAYGRWTILRKELESTVIQQTKIHTCNVQTHLESTVIQQTKESESLCRSRTSTSVLTPQKDTPQAHRATTTHIGDWTSHTNNTVKGQVQVLYPPMVLRVLRNRDG